MGPNKKRGHVVRIKFQQGISQRQRHAVLTIAQVQIRCQSHLLYR